MPTGTEEDKPVLYRHRERAIEAEGTSGFGIGETGVKNLPTTHHVSGVGRDSQKGVSSALKKFIPSGMFI